MKADKFFYEVFPLFEDIFQKFINEITPLNYKIYKIKKYHRVILIADSLVISFELKEKYPEKTELERVHLYEFFDKKVVFLYFIQIEELTANDIFHFNATKFRNQFEPYINTFYFIHFKKFSSVAALSPIHETVELFNHVNKKVKKLKLKERQELWEGWLYNFILFEITNFNGDTTVCSWSTRLTNINIIAYQKCKELQQFCISGYGANPYYINKIEKNFIVTSNFKTIAQSIRAHFRNNKHALNLYNKIKYAIIPKTLKNESSADNVSLQLIDEYKKGKLNNLEFYYYNKTPIKWKSEYLVKELCEKIFGESNIIYQYRPFFLATQRGQLSYDIYLVKEKIAIEYQGKQHFQPVNYFGGEKTFLKQKERDELKKQLSAKNHITLIYINYNDPITEEFIIAKVTGAKNHGRRIH